MIPHPLSKAPTVDTGMLIRRPPQDVFTALADPSITTRFWFTRSTGRVTEGAELRWEWAARGASATVWVKEAEPGRNIRFTWDRSDPANPTPPTTVEFQFIPYENDTTYLLITETGFAGDADTQARRALDDMRDFTFLLGSLKAALEHDVTLRVTEDAHPPYLNLP